MSKFNPTPENLKTLSESLTVEHAEQLLAMVVRRSSHPYATSYEFFLNSQGIESTCKTTGPDFLNDLGVSMRNLRGEWVDYAT